MGKMFEVGVVKRSEKYIRERAIYKATPLFHSDAALQSADSSLKVNITISPEGEVTSATCSKASAALCQMAEEAAYRWRFQPMKADGFPATITSHLTFQLGR